MSNPLSLTAQVHELSPHSLTEAHTCESQRTLERAGSKSTSKRYGQSIGAKEVIENSRPSTENREVRVPYNYRPILAETPYSEWSHLLKTKTDGV